MRICVCVYIYNKKGKSSSLFYNPAPGGKSVIQKLAK